MGDHAREHAVQEGLGAGCPAVDSTALAARPNHHAAGIHPHEVVVTEGRLVFAAGGDHELQRLPRGNHAVVAAGAKRPAIAMKLTADRLQVLHRG